MADLFGNRWFGLRSFGARWFGGSTASEIIVDPSIPTHLHSYVDDLPDEIDNDPDPDETTVEDI